MNSNNNANLPLAIRVVNSKEDLNKVSELRYASYSRHGVDFAKNLVIPEAADSDAASIVLLVESIADENAPRFPLGTMRIHLNAGKPLPLESSVVLPFELASCSLAEAVRFGVVEGIEGIRARNALFKAFYMICSHLRIDQMVVSARFPVYKLYLNLHFSDVFPSREFFPLKHVGNIPHRILALQVDQVEMLWRVNNHPLYDYFFNSVQPKFDFIPKYVESLNFSPKTA